MSTIKALFNGNIYPFEMMSCSKESLEAEKELNEYLKIVDANCPKKEGTTFSEEIRFKFSEIQTLTAEQAFKIGFSLGVRLISECFNDKTH